MCFIFHKWGKWEQFDDEMIEIISFRGVEISKSEPYIVRKQRKKCLKCGKVREKKI